MEVIRLDKIKAEYIRLVWFLLTTAMHTSVTLLKSTLEASSKQSSSSNNDKE